jgi:DNA-3-methyladenine glycosylase I
MYNKRWCSWAGSNNSLMIEYHVKEWGIPLHNDRTLFEFLILEGAQATLTWQTVLNKRENYRRHMMASMQTKSPVMERQM